MQNNFGGRKESIEDRLDHLEKTLPNLARLNDFLACYDNVKALSDKLITLSSAFESSQEKQTQNRNYLQALEDELISQKKNSYLQHKDHVDTSKAIQENIQGVKMQLQTLNANHEDHLQTTRDLSSQMFMYASESDLEDHKQSIFQDMVIFNNQFTQYQSTLEDIKKQLGQIRSDITKIKESNLEYYVTNDRHKKEIKDNLETQRVTFNEFRNGVNGNFDKIKDGVKQQIEQLPKPEIPSFDHVKGDIVKHLEPMTLDVKNALLKSANVDMKVSILEKKIEQVTLLVKNLELSKEA